MDIIRNMMNKVIRYGWINKDIKYKLINMGILLDMIKLVILYNSNSNKINKIIKDGNYNKIKAITSSIQTLKQNQLKTNSKQQNNSISNNNTPKCYKLKQNPNYYLISNNNYKIQII